jgi:hypothetical protein
MSKERSSGRRRSFWLMWKGKARAWPLGSGDTLPARAEALLSIKPGQLVEVGPF